MNKLTYKWYPENQSSLYYVEIMDGLGSNPHWTLYKRNYIGDSEVHPWNLGGNILAPDTIMAMGTRKFLMFMVDALNEKIERERNKTVDTSVNS